jgi:hypothetical protein
MGSKKQKRAVDKPIRKAKERDKSLAVLRAELATTTKALKKAKARADRWRRRAEEQERAAKQARARVEKLQRKLGGPSTAPAAAAPTDAKAAVAPDEPTTVAAVSVPDETWSVVQLRAEARARGLTGMSNKTKAQLLSALS